jgi:hypothetical protein
LKYVLRVVSVLGLKRSIARTVVLKQHQVKKSASSVGCGSNQCKAIGLICHLTIKRNLQRFSQVMSFTPEDGTGPHSSLGGFGHWQKACGYPS